MPSIFSFCLGEAVNDSFLMPGGRVKQVRPFKGCQLLDVGGEFIHGEKTTAAKLAKELSWKIEVFFSRLKNS